MKLKTERLTGVLIKGVSALGSLIASFFVRHSVARCGSGLRALEGIRLTGGRNIRIGRNCFIGRRVVLDAGQGKLEIGDNVEIRDDTRIYATDIHIASGATLGESVFLLGRIRLEDSAWLARKCDLSGSVSIGKAILGPGVQCVGGGNHARDPESGAFVMSGEDTRDKDLSIRISDGAWVGQNAVILKGVTIGNNALVAAGAIVTQTVPDQQTARGVPARNFESR